MALHCWYHFPAGLGADYAFATQYDTGLAGLGISLKLGLNGIALPLYVLAGLVGLAAGLYAIQSQAERLKVYLMLLLIMQGGLMGVFASVDVFFFYFFHELALIPTFIERSVALMNISFLSVVSLALFFSVANRISLFLFWRGAKAGLSSTPGDRLERP